MYHSKFGGLQGKDHSKLFEGGVAQVYCMWYLGGSWGHPPQENFVKLDAERSLLRQFLGPKSHVLQFLAKNGISMLYVRYSRLRVT